MSIFKAQKKLQRKRQKKIRKKGCDCKVGDKYKWGEGVSKIIALFFRREGTEFESLCRAVHYKGSDEDYDRILIEEYEPDNMGNMSWRTSSWYDNEEAEFILHLLDTGR